MNKPEKIMTVKEVQNNWNDMATIYHEFDSAPQSFYFAIVSMLQMQKAKAVLEVGCGRCVLVPYALDLLNSNAIYFATDLAPKMIELAESRLKGTLQRFSSSLSFQQWCKKNNFTLKVANGEEIIQPNIKFDRIICNMVMMLTEDPQKMLKSFYQQAQQGCLLGVSVWGQKELNTFHEQIERIAAELKVQKPVKSRSNFHLYNKVPELAQKEGWKLVVKWDQVSSFPYLNVKDFEWYAQSMSSKMTYLSEQQRKWVYDQYMRRQTQRLQVKKQAFLFPAQISIYRK